MQKPIPLFKVYMSPNVDKPLSEVLHSGWIGQGEKVREFEEALSDMARNRYCLSLACGTHGLHLALRLLGIDEGDEVITSALTCTATNWPILMQKAKIVWADIDPEDLNISPLSIKQRITARTKAILVTHWGGYPCNMKATLREMAGGRVLLALRDRNGKKPNQPELWIHAGRSIRHSRGQKLK